MRFRGCVVPIVLCAVSFFFPVHLWAQDTTGTGAIAGLVMTHDKKPGLAVTVCLVDSIRCVLSDNAGKFRLTDVRSGSFRLEVTPPGEPRFVTEPIEVRAGLDALVEI